jgi:glycosyltransferase involved in cell wall biosynthesis
VPRLLLWSDSVCAKTGFSRVARTICGALSEDWEIIQVGLNHPDRLVEHDYVQIHIAPEDEPTGLKLARDLYLEQDFDLFIIIQDLHITAQWASTFTAAKIVRRLQAKPPVPTIYHYPVDGPMAGDVDFLHFADDNISATHWGVRTLEPLLPMVDVAVIPHAVDTSVFHALPSRERAELKSEIYGIRPTDETLAVLSVGVNSERKDHFTSLAAIHELNREEVKGKLYLHTKGVANGMDTYSQAVALDLTSLEYHVADTSLLGCSDEALNRLYNASDCLLFSSRREGFGIPMIEAMAAGVSVLAPDYGPFKEVLRDGNFGYLHSPSGLVWLRDDHRGPSWQSSAQTIARHLDFLHAATVEAWDAPPEKLSAAVEHVKSTYSLEVVTTLWRDKIKEIAHEG